MTTGDVVYSLRFSLIKILPEPGFDLGSTAGESCVLTAGLHMLYNLLLHTVLVLSTVGDVLVLFPFGHSLRQDTAYCDYMKPIGKQLDVTLLKEFSEFHNVHSSDSCHSIHTYCHYFVNIK